MAWKPDSYEMHCNNCGWKKRYAPPSDALPRGMIPEECPQCGSRNLEREYARQRGGDLLDLLRRFTKLR